MCETSATPALILRDLVPERDGKVKFAGKRNPNGIIKNSRQLKEIAEHHFSVWCLVPPLIRAEL